MANGAVAHLASEVAPSAAPEPAPDVAGANLEKEIAAAVAFAASALAMAMLSFQENGRLAPADKQFGGAMIAKLVELSLRYDDEIDFGVIARREGHRALQPLLNDAEFRTLHPAPASEKTLSFIVDGVLDIAARVVALERARAN